MQYIYIVSTVTRPGEPPRIKKSPQHAGPFYTVVVLLVPTVVTYLLRNEAWISSLTTHDTVSAS
jgi:hypothetical protein